MALLDAATFGIAAGLLATMRVVEPAPEPRTGHLLAGIADGARHLRRTIPLRQVTVASGVALLVIGFSETLTFEVAGRGLGRDPSFVGSPVDSVVTRLVVVVREQGLHGAGAGRNVRGT